MLIRFTDDVAPADADGSVLGGVTYPLLASGEEQATIWDHQGARLVGPELEAMGVDLGDIHPQHLEFVSRSSPLMLVGTARFDDHRGPNHDLAGVIWIARLPMR